MKMHYSDSKQLDYMLPRNDTWSECGKSIPFEHITDDLKEVTCKNCLKVIISNAHWTIKECSRTTIEFSKEIKEAQSQLDKINRGIQ